MLLAEAAVLGRHFSLKDLREIEMEVRDVDADPDALTAALAPAVAAGLLVEHGEDSPADYSFPHEQVQEFAMGTLLPARRRAIHAAIVSLLLYGEPAPASLPLLAHHAKAAGDASVCVRFSVAASRNALDANAPEEVLRVVDLSLPLAATPQERVDLLEARDRALEMLRRPDDRMQGLAELAALSEAMADSHLELDVRLRRAAALRMNEDHDRAAQLAHEVMELAASRGDRESELAACIELGQDLLQSAAGETFVPAARELDLEGAEQAYARALLIAREVGDDPDTALVLRELGVIALGRMRDWFINATEAGETLPLAMRVAGGEALDDIMPELPIASSAQAGAASFEEALEIFERIGDRRGAMSTIIAMGYLNWAPDIHMGAGAGRHIEEIRRLTSRMTALTTASDRASAEAQMLYGVHVFARAKVIPDLAVSRGEETFREASEIGDPALSFLAAGGTAMAYLDLDERRPPHRGSIAPPRSPRRTPRRCGLAGWRRGAASRRLPTATPTACAPIWSVLRIWRPTTDGPRRGARCWRSSRRGRPGWASRGVTRSCSGSPSGRRTRSSSWRLTCRGTPPGRRRPTRCWRRSRWPGATRAGPRSSRGRRSSGSWRRGRKTRTSRSCCRRHACSATSGRRRPRSRSVTWGTTPR